MKIRPTQEQDPRASIASRESGSRSLIGRSLGRRGGAPRVGAILALGLLAACCVSACGSSGGGSGNAPTVNAAAAASGKCTAPSKVTIGGLGYGIVLPGDVARLMGGFKKVEQECHTTIQYASLTSPQPLFANLLRGGYQFIELTVANEIQAATEGQNFQTVATLSQGGSGIFASHKQIGTGLSALKSLGSSASVGMISVGGISSVFLKAMWKAAGLNPDTVKQVPLGVSGIAPSVVSGKLAMGYDQPTPLAPDVSSHQLYPILNTSGPTAYKVTGFLPAVGLISVPSFTSKYPVLTAKITAAEIQGIYWLRKHRKSPDTLYNAMPASVKATTPQASWDTAWNWNLSVGMAETGQITAASLVQEAKAMQEYGVIPKSFNVNQLASTKYVDSANVTAAYKVLGMKPPGPTDFIDTKILESMPK